MTTFDPVVSVNNCGMIGVLPLLTAQITNSETYLGIFLQGQKVGYASYLNSPVQFEGISATKSTSVTEIKIGLIGSQVEMRIDSETISVGSKTLQMKVTLASGGRTQDVFARFNDKSVECSVNNNGAKSQKTLPIPANASIVDDPVTEILARKPESGEKDFYVFDPTTITLIKNTARLKSKSEIDVLGKKVTAQEIEIEDPRLMTSVFSTDSGEIVKVTTSLGFDMVAMSKSEAIAASTSTKEPDLADLTSIVPHPSIDNPAGLKHLKIQLAVDNLKSVPNDAYQRVKKVNGVWEIENIPLQLPDQKSASIAKAGASKPEWVKPGLHVPSASKSFKTLSKQIIGKRSDVKSAALAIRSWVNSNMSFNAGIGVLRDASEILRKREGVCRDYAILTATLTRAAGIPTKIVSGIVNFDGNFYYHAWVEVYTGFDWVPMDSVPMSAHFSATHVKLSQGSVEDAFTFTVLSKARMDVLLAK